VASKPLGVFYLFFKAAALPGVGAVLAPPSSVAFAAPVVQAVAVSAGGGSYAGVLRGAE
jgi:hypothetical protein